LVLTGASSAYCAVRRILVLATRQISTQADGIAASDVVQVVRFTRLWIHYGFIAHTVLCVLIAAVEGLMGR